MPPLGSQNASTRRRPKRKPTVTAGTNVIVGISILLIGLFWTVGVGIFSLSLNDGSSKREQARLFPGFPKNSVDLWPNDESDADFSDSLRDCESSSEQAQAQLLCQERLDGATRRIALASPPGVFGRVLHDFAIQVVGLYSDDETNAVLVPTSHIGTDHTFTNVVRVVTLPLLLQALDLALVTIDPSNASTVMINREDILGVVRQLVAWHCRLSEIALDTSMTTIYFGHTLANPTSADVTLAKFLSLTDDADVENAQVVDMEENAAQVLMRIDECVALAHKIQAAVGPSSQWQLQDDVDRIVEEELQRESCSSTIPALTMGAIPDSRVTEIVGHLLDTEAGASIKICRTYPEIAFCTETAAADK